jgi:hypothetical protein
MLGEFLSRKDRKKFWIIFGVVVILLAAGIFLSFQGFTA